MVIQRSLKEQLEQAQKEINALRAEKTAAPVAPVAPITEVAAPAAPAADEATIEAEVARRIAAIPPPDITAAVEAEVTKRLSQMSPSGNSASLEAAVAQELAQNPHPDNTAAIEAEVQRRLAAVPPTDNAAAIEAEISRRLALIPPPDNSAAIGAEVNRRLAEIQANQLAQPSQPAQATPDVEALVAERVAAERQKVEARIAEARNGFQAYKAAAVNKAVEQKTTEFNGLLAAKEEEHKKETAQLQTTIEGLQKEIETLKKQLEVVKSQADTANSSSNEEEFKKALEVKEQEHQQAIEELKKEEQSRIEEAKTELTHQLQADFLARNTEPDATKKPPPTKEELTAIIKKNVEHRLQKEKAKWELQVEAEREKIIEEKVNSMIEEKMKAKETEMHATLEKSKDALRQEGQARIKVQLNMLEKKNKVLEEKLKAALGDTGAAPTAPQTAIPPPGQQNQLPQSGIKPPGQSTIPLSLHPGQHQQDNSQLPAPSAAAQRRDAVGTGPAALRSLRGALASNIPRGGGGRGAPQIGRGGSQAGSPTQSHPPQQFPPLGQQQSMGLQGQQQPQFGSRMSLPTGQQQTQLPRGGAMMVRGIFRPQGQGRGAGGQGQNQGAGSPIQQQLPNIQTGLPMAQQQGSQQSPGRMMNPGARQFVPVKRVREDGTEGDDAGAQTHGATAGKRIRGGHNG